MIGTDEEGLTHMRHVKETCGRTRMQMFGEHAVFILNGHVIARERHHLCSQLDMERVQGRDFEGLDNVTGVVWVICAHQGFQARANR